MNADGSNQTRLTDNPVPGARPEWCFFSHQRDFIPLKSEKVFILTTIILISIFLMLIFLRRRNPHQKPEP